MRKKKPIILSVSIAVILLTAIGIVVFFAIPQSILNNPEDVRQASIGETGFTLKSTIFDSLTTGGSEVNPDGFGFRICGENDGRFSLDNDYDVSGNKLTLKSSMNHNAGANKNCFGNYVEVEATLQPGTWKIECNVKSMLDTDGEEALNICEVKLDGQLKGSIYACSRNGGSNCASFAQPGIHYKNEGDEIFTQEYTITEPTSLNILTTNGVSGESNVLTEIEISLLPANMPPTEEPPTPIPSDGLKIWEIVAIVLGVIFIIFIIIYFLLKRKK